jgi:hypothetical protein
VDDDGSASHGDDEIFPVVACHERKHRTTDEEAMDSLKTRGHAVSLSTEAARMGVKYEASAEQPRAAVGDQSGNDRRIGDDHDTWPAPEQLDGCGDATARPTPEDRWTTRPPGWEKRNGSATKDSSDLGGAATDGAPCQKEDIVTPLHLPSVSVVIATHNRCQRIAPLAELLLRDPAATEIIFVDDASSDRSAAELDRLASSNDRVRTLSVSFRRQQPALDAGLALASSQVVLFLDDDVLPCADLVTRHATKHAEHQRSSARGAGEPLEALCVVGYMPVADEMLDAGTSRLYAKEYEAACVLLESSNQSVLEHLWGGNVSLARSLARDAGMTSLRFNHSYHADRELGYRLADRGMVGVFDRSLASVHLHRRSRDAWLVDCRRAGEGLAALHLLYPDRLGPYDPSKIVDDLPRVLCLAVRHAASSTGGARVLCYLLWSTATLMGRCHQPRGEEVLLRIARRVMRLHGAARVMNGE